MKLCTGIDIVEIAQFKRSLKNGGETFLKKIFTGKELENVSPEHLAGLFAAKEAVVKALSLKPGRWLEFEIENEASGRPKVIFSEAASHDFQSYDLSISHAGGFAIAVFVGIK